MNYLYAAVFGLVQGISEFLPISSSGHLVILHEFIDLPIANKLAFDVLLHFATLLAVIIYFKKDIFLLIKSWLASFFGKKNEYSRLAWLIILAGLPAGFMGLIFEEYIENVLRSVWVVVVMLVLIGILFIIIEKTGKKINTTKNLNWKQALFIGIAQVMALIPGTSRSGITIIAGMANNLKREEAVKFSFLLSIPVILGASLKKIPLVFLEGFNSQEAGITALAFAISFFSGFLAIKYFLKFAKKYSLAFFAGYRFILAVVLFFYFFIFTN